MPASGPTGYAFNRTRQAYLATQLCLAGTHWSRLRGLMCTDAASFPAGQGLWIVPSRGVHTFAMRFPIDVVYLDRHWRVVAIRERVVPYRLTWGGGRARGVLEFAAGEVARLQITDGQQLLLRPHASLTGRPPR